MNKVLSPPVIKAIIATTILLVLISANSIMNCSYAITKNTPIQNESNLPTLAPTPSRLLGTLDPPLLGSTTFLSVVTKVDNTNGGTKKPSDFTITVYGNSPRPRTFSGSSSGISVGLKAGIYKVIASHIPDYAATYSSGCSGTASGGVPLKCTITNQYHGRPAPPPLPINPFNIIITSDSNSVYSIPSTFVKVDRFSTNYTIAGKISSISASRNLITSAIIDDFDKNPNIGYVISNSGSLNISQPSLPNPFVSKDIINQKITNETQNAIIAASVTNPAEKSIKIKCTFGMVLAGYKCY